MMPRGQLPASRSYDGLYTYMSPAGWDGRCYLQVFESTASLPVAIAWEEPFNPGPSITNAAATLATQVWRQLLPRAREGLRFVECYMDPTYPDPAGRERFAEVLFRLDGNRLHDPQWRPINRAELEALIGGPLSAPVADSYYRHAGSLI